MKTFKLTKEELQYGLFNNTALIVFAVKTPVREEFRCEHFEYEEEEWFWGNPKRTVVLDKKHTLIFNKIRGFDPRFSEGCTLYKDDKGVLYAGDMVSCMTEFKPLVRFE